MTDTSTPLSHLRRQPSQDRSAQRFELILDTMAALVDEVGYGAITISLIAKRSEMSGPAVYRYFDDLQSISRALATRNLHRFLDKANAAIADGSGEWPDTMLAALDSLSDMYRTEPGFRGIRLGDGIDRNLIDPSETNRGIVARMLAERFIERYGDPQRENFLGHIYTVVEIADSLIGRAFEADPDGDKFFIDECRRIVVSYLDEYVARPSTNA